MRTICITIDDALLRAVDRAARSAKRTRSEVCRTALKAWLASARHRERMRVDREAYLRTPVAAEEFGKLITAHTLLSDDEHD